MVVYLNTLDYPPHNILANNMILNDICHNIHIQLLIYLIVLKIFINEITNYIEWK